MPEQSAKQFELIQSVLGAVGRRDLPAILAGVHQEVEIQPLVSVWPRTYSGHDGIEEWSRDLSEVWDEFTVSADESRPLDDETLLVLVTWRGLPRGTANEVGAPGAAIVRFRDDKASYAAFYVDEAAALKGANR